MDLLLNGLGLVRMRQSSLLRGSSFGSYAACPVYDEEAVFSSSIKLTLEFLRTGNCVPWIFLGLVMWDAASTSMGQSEISMLHAAEREKSPEKLGLECDGANGSIIQNERAFGLACFLSYIHPRLKREEQKDGYWACFSKRTKRYSALD